MTTEQQRVVNVRERDATGNETELQHGDEGEECPDCHEQMTWCSACVQWTKTCCQDYGSCQCN